MPSTDDELNDHVSMVALDGGPHDGLSVPVNNASLALGSMAVKVGDELVGYYIRQPAGSWQWGEGAAES